MTTERDRALVDAAIEAAAKELGDLHPYVFSGHMNDFRRNRDTAIKSLSAINREALIASVPWRWISVKVRLPEATPFQYMVSMSAPVAVIHDDRPDYPLIAHATFTNSAQHAGAGIAIPTNGASPFRFVSWYSAAIRDLANPFFKVDQDYGRYLPRLFGQKITYWTPLPVTPTTRESHEQD